MNHHVLIIMAAFFSVKCKVNKIKYLSVVKESDKVFYLLSQEIVFDGRWGVGAGQIGRAYESSVIFSSCGIFVSKEHPDCSLDEH